MGDVCLFTLVEGYRAVWEVTNRCNYLCKHCCASAETNPLNSDLSTGEMKRVMDNLASVNLNSIYFSGGEPFIRDDIIEIVKYAARTVGHSRINIATNGRAINDEIAEQLAEIKLGCVLVSLDGHDQLTAAQFRGPASSYNDAYEALECLSRHGVKTRMGVVIWRDNREHLEEMVRIGVEAGADNIFFNWLMPAGRAACDLNIRLPASEYGAVAEELRELQQRFAGNITVGYHRFNELVNGDETCKAGSRLVHVTYDGRVSPCSWLHKTGEGWLSTKTLVEHPLSSLLEEHPFTTVTEALSERERLGVGPGCLAMCKAFGGGYNARDPLLSGESSWMYRHE